MSLTSQKLTDFAALRDEPQSDVDVEMMLLPSEPSAVLLEELVHVGERLGVNKESQSRMLEEVMSYSWSYSERSEGWITGKAEGRLRQLLG